MRYNSEVSLYYVYNYNLFCRERCVVAGGPAVVAGTGTAAVEGAKEDGGDKLLQERREGRVQGLRHCQHLLVDPRLQGGGGAWTPEADIYNGYSVYAHSEVAQSMVWLAMNGPFLSPSFEG